MHTERALHMCSLALAESMRHVHQAWSLHTLLGGDLYLGCDNEIARIVSKIIIATIIPRYRLLAQTCSFNENQPLAGLKELKERILNQTKSPLRFLFS